MTGPTPVVEGIKLDRVDNMACGDVSKFFQKGRKFSCARGKGCQDRPSFLPGELSAGCIGFIGAAPEKSCYVKLAATLLLEVGLAVVRPVFPSQKTGEGLSPLRPLRLLAPSIYRDPASSRFRPIFLLSRHAHHQPARQTRPHR